VARSLSCHQKQNRGCGLTDRTPFFATAFAGGLLQVGECPYPEQERKNDMTRTIGILTAAVCVASFGIGFTELLHSVSHQTTIISTLVAAAGLMGIVILTVLHGSEVEQAKFDCDFIGAAGIMLEMSPNYGVWQDTIDRLNVIASRTIWTPLQKQNAADAQALLNEAGEGDDPLSLRLRGIAA